MSDSGGLGSVLKWGLLAGGVYFVYQAVTNAATSPAAAAAAPAGATPSTPVTGSLSLQDLVTAIQQAQQQPAAAVSPAAAPDVKALILAASAADYPNNADPNRSEIADVWNYWRNRVTTPLTSAQWAQAFPNMTATDRGPSMTLDQFLAQVATVAPSGMGAISIPVPVRVMANGKPVMVWAARDVPASGPARVAVFSNAHPFLFGVRPLPVARWQRA